MSVTSPYGAPAGDRRNGVAAPPPLVSGAAAAPPATGDRLPRPPRRRRPGFAALAVLLVVGAAAAAGLLAIRLDSRTPMLVAAKPLEVGHQITRADLATVRISAASGLQLIPESAADTVIGTYVAQEIPAGRPLDPAMLTNAGLLRDGTVAIGVPLTAGSAPASGVRSGDRVDIVRAVDGEGVILASDAVVGSVTSPESSSGFGETSGGGDSIVTVIVKEGPGAGGKKVSAQIAAAAAAGQVALVLVERGGAGG